MKVRMNTRTGEKRVSDGGRKIGRKGGEKEKHEYAYMKHTNEEKLNTLFCLLTA